MRGKFYQILMQAFQRNVATIHIIENGSIIFEKHSRFKGKKIQILSTFTIDEVVQLMHYIKKVSKVKKYEIEPCDYSVVIGGCYMQLHIFCIPSMYFEEIVLRIVSCTGLKIERQNTKIRYPNY